MPQLPPEIWTHIAHLLPGKDLRQVYGVNRALFHSSMDHRWGQIVIENRDLQEAGHLLKRLSDRFIASRVKVLEFRLHKLETSSPSWHMLNLRPIRNFTSMVVSVTHPGKTKRYSRLSSFKEFCAVLIRRVPRMINVKELTINFYMTPESPQISRVYRSFWRAFGKKLEKLVVIGPPRAYGDVVSSEPALSNLKTLHIVFASCFFSTHNFYEDRTALAGLFTPFVKGLSSHLLELAITLRVRHLDISPFFVACGSFPRLHSLMVYIPFDTALLDPSGLQKFISRTAGTVKHLKLRLNPFGHPWNGATDMKLEQWLIRCLKDERWLSNVEELELYPGKADVGLRAATASIHRSSRTLCCLFIRDRYWTNPEALIIVDAMVQCSRLVHVSMNISQLDIELWDRMAECLPNLQTLKLSIGALETAEKFSAELRTRRYAEWKLNDLSLMWYRDGSEYEMDTRFMLGLCVSIPSIESFFGRLHDAPRMYSGDGR